MHTEYFIITEDYPVGYISLTFSEHTKIPSRIFPMEYVEPGLIYNDLWLWSIDPRQFLFLQLTNFKELEVKDFKIIEGSHARVCQVYFSKEDVSEGIARFKKEPNETKLAIRDMINRRSELKVT